MNHIVRQRITRTETAFWAGSIKTYFHRLKNILLVSSDANGRSIWILARQTLAFIAGPSGGQGVSCPAHHRSANAMIPKTPRQLNLPAAIPQNRKSARAA